MPDQISAAWLSALADNLASRGRMGLDLVKGDMDGLNRMLDMTCPGPPPSALEKVRRDLGNCTRCPLHEGRGKLVFGAGAEDARIMLIGEGPGQQEDRIGDPFVGPAGKLLDRMLKAIGLERGQVYITNIVKCRPPGNRDPKPEEVRTCRPFLEAQVKAISPRLIMSLGKPASQSLLASDAPISALRGRWREFMEIPLLPTFHPAFLLRNPERKKEAYRDLKTLAKALAAD
jgi:uracil-DNA glycosylase family 4